jgi:hypothetical protein
MPVLNMARTIPMIIGLVDSTHANVVVTVVVTVIGHINRFIITTITGVHLRAATTIQSHISADINVITAFKRHHFFVFFQSNPLIKH